MYQPGEDSVAEETYRLANAILDGKFRGRKRLLYDHRGSNLVDLADREKLAEAIHEAYGEALEWNSVEGIMDDIFDPRSTVQDSRRYFLNALVEGSNAWLSQEELEDATEGMPTKWGGVVKDGERITLGFDGALTNDATALVACRVSDGLLFPVFIEERPDGPEAKTWHVNEKKFDAAVHMMFKRFEVVGFFADPPYWLDWVDKWEKEFGDQLLVSGSPQKKIAFFTSKDSAMHWALQRLKLAIGKREVKMIPHRQFIRHMTNAQKWTRNRGYEVIGKETKNSVKKIDSAIAATLAFEARARYLAKPEEKKPEKQSFVPIKVR